jgi:hypothetical protein
MPITPVDDRSSSGKVKNKVREIIYFLFFYGEPLSMPTLNFEQLLPFLTDVVVVLVVIVEVVVVVIVMIVVVFVVVVRVVQPSYNPNNNYLFEKD